MPNQDEYYAWAWSPHWVAQSQKRESGLILPDPEPAESALCHFSIMRSGIEYSWLWLFRDMPQAVALRMLPQYLPEDDPVRDLIEATIPSRSPGESAKTYVQIVPARWFTHEWDLYELGIHEVWIGFDFRSFGRSRDLRAAASAILGVDEFEQRLRRSA